jgi:type I restriction enzyme S subunit
MADLSIPTNDGQSEQTAESLITQHIDIWTTAIERKSSAGRGTSNKFSLYGIKKLRELILELAMRGKLVPQDPDDEPASVLLERIAAEKVQLVKDKKIKKPKALLEIGEEEKIFELPHSWEWSRLNDISLLKGGFAFKSSLFLDDGLHQVIRMGNIRPDNLRLNEKAVFIPTEQAQLTEEYEILSGDILLTMTGTKGKRDYLYSLCVDESALEKRKLYLNQRLCIVRGVLVSQRFVNAVIKCDTLLTDIYAKSTGTANQANIGMEAIINWPLPIPPLEEQHRIVAKVDELMCLCDALEAQTEASISAHQTLVETLLNALLRSNTTQPAVSQSASPEASFADSLEPALNDSFIDSWQRVAEHFNTLFTTESSIDTLKQTILQLAVMGKLVEQDPNDEPAAKLLERIAAEKAQLIADKKIKKQKPLPTITDEEKPFELPQGWEWVRFGSLVNFQAELVRPEEFLDYDQIAPDSIEKGTGKLLKRRTVRDSGVKGPNSRFYTGQILYSKIRPSLSKAVIAEFDGLCSADMYPLQSMVYSKYLLKSILSEVFLEQVRVAENRIKMPKLNIDSLSDIMLPLAPIEEQHCIVTKVDELMALCDQLKARLSDAQTTQLHLTDAIVEQAI